MSKRCPVCNWSNMDAEQETCSEGCAKVLKDINDADAWVELMARMKQNSPFRKYVKKRASEAKTGG